MIYHFIVCYEDMTSTLDKSFSRDERSVSSPFSQSRATPHSPAISHAPTQSSKYLYTLCACVCVCVYKQKDYICTFSSNVDIHARWWHGQVVNTSD